MPLLLVSLHTASLADAVGRIAWLQCGSSVSLQYSHRRQFAVACRGAACHCRPLPHRWCRRCPAPLQSHRCSVVCARYRQPRFQTSHGSVLLLQRRGFGHRGQGQSPETHLRRQKRLLVSKSVSACLGSRDWDVLPFNMVLWRGGSCGCWSEHKL
jgi:hypothetical protein